MLPGQMACTRMPCGSNLGWQRDVRPLQDPSARDHDVESPELVHRGSGQRAAVPFLRHVGLDVKPVAARVFDCLYRTGRLVFEQVGDHHLRALYCQFSRRGAPDSARAAGDNRYLVLQPSSHWSLPYIFQAIPVRASTPSNAAFALGILASGKCSINA